MRSHCARSRAEKTCSVPAGLHDRTLAWLPFAWRPRQCERRRGGREQHHDAAWIWNIATAKFPEATRIVDLYHAREHLHSLTRSLEFMLGDRRDEWLAARLGDLDYGDINGIEAAVREYPLEGIKKDEVGKELGYFLNNAPRMRYRWFRSRKPGAYR